MLHARRGESNDQLAIRRNYGSNNLHFNGSSSSRHRYYERRVPIDDFDDNYDDGGISLETGKMLANSSVYSSRHHQQFYADEFFTGDDTDEDCRGVHNTDSHLTPPCEEDELTEAEDYLVPSVMRNGNCYLAANYNEKTHYASKPKNNGTANTTAKKPSAHHFQEHSPECNDAMPMTPPSSSGSSCLLFIFVENPRDVTVLDKLTFPFEDNLTVMDMMVRVAASKRFVVSEYKAYQFDFDTLRYRLLKPNMTMDQLRHNCVHLFVRNSTSVIDQDNGNREHHVYLNARLWITPARYLDRDISIKDCISRKFWVPESIAVIELLFFLCDRHALNWREWELWIWIKQKTTPSKPLALPPQMIQLKNLNKLLSYSNYAKQLNSSTTGHQDATKDYITIVLLPKGVGTRQVEEIADALMSDPQKKMKSGRIRRFFSRIFSLGKRRKHPKKAHSNIDVSDTPRSQLTGPPAFRSQHDLSVAAKSISAAPMPVTVATETPPVPINDQELQENARASPLPRVNFHKKHHAPTPPIRSIGASSVESEQKRLSRNTSNSSNTSEIVTKKRTAPRPDLVTKISIQPDSDDTMQSPSFSVPSVEISSIRDSQNTTTEMQSQSLSLPSERLVRTIENPVYVKSVEAVTTETRETADSLIHSVQQHEYAVASSVTQPCHVVSVSVTSEECCLPKIIECKEKDDVFGKMPATPNICTVHVSDSSSEAERSTTTSPDLSTKDKTGDTTSLSVSSPLFRMDSPSRPLTLDSPPNSSVPSVSSSERNESSLSNEKTESQSEQSIIVEQPKSVTLGSNNRGVIKIRSGYDISSVAKRTKVIGGGKVKDTANLLSESTIVAGLRQLTTAVNSTSSLNSAFGASNRSATLPQNGENKVIVIGSSKTNDAVDNSERSPNRGYRTPAAFGKVSNIAKKLESGSTDQEIGESDGTEGDDSNQPGKDKIPPSFQSRVDLRIALTKRASLYTPRPFVPFATSPPSSSRKSPNNSAKINHQPENGHGPPSASPPPPPPPPPPPLPSEIKHSATPTKSSSPMSLQLPSSHNSPSCSVSPPSSASSRPNSSVQGSSGRKFTTPAKGQSRPSSQVSSRTESPREQMLNAIRNNATVANLKKVPAEEKRYINTVETFINSDSPAVATPTMS